MTKIEELAKEAGANPEYVADSLRIILQVAPIDTCIKDMFKRWLSDYTDNKNRKKVK